MLLTDFCDFILFNKTFDKNKRGRAEFTPERDTAKENSFSAASKSPFKHWK